jgi:hypothetical protein
MYVRLAQSELTRVKHPAEQNFSLHIYVQANCLDWQYSVLPLPQPHPWLNWPQDAAYPSLQLVLRLIMYGACTGITHIKRCWTAESINSVCSADQLRVAVWWGNVTTPCEDTKTKDPAWRTEQWLATSYVTVPAPLQTLYDVLLV